MGTGLEKERPGGPEDWLIRRHESIEYGVMSIGCGNVSGGGWRPQLAGGGQDIFGSQVSAIGSQVRVRVRVRA
jgi:hypothetical protein